MAEKRPNLDSLFEAAVEMKSAAERAAFLDQSCGDDLELRKQLELLLTSDEQAGSCSIRGLLRFTSWGSLPTSDRSSP